MGLSWSKPEDIHSSKEAQKIADWLMLFGDFPKDIDLHKTFDVSQLTTVDRIFAAARYYERAEELRMLGM